MKFLKHTFIFVLVALGVRANAQNITANFSATTVCFNNPTCFTDLSSSINGPIVTWSWDFGDGSPLSTFQNPCHTYNSAGIYTVCLIVTNSNNDADTACSQITVNALPVPNFSVTTVCTGMPTCFTDMSTISSGTIATWNWDFGDPASGFNSSNVQNPCHLFTSPGTFIVTLTVTSNNGCQSTIMLLASVYSLPVAAFTANKACLNSPTLFIDNSTGVVQWDWYFGDGNISTQQNPFHTYLGYGDYVVTLVVTSAAG